MPARKGKGGKKVTRKGVGKKAISRNIGKLIKAGVKPKQAIAEAISIERQSAKEKGKKPVYPRKKSSKK